MTSFQPTPSQLAIRLTLYFAVFFGAMITMVSVWPDAMDNLPFGGHHALDFSEIKDETLTLAKPESGDEDSGGFTATFRQTTSSITKGVLFLSLHLSGTILLMIPITWTYMATRRDIGYQKNFARALIVLPICATTIVLLIQDSLALAFWACSPGCCSPLSRGIGRSHRRCFCLCSNLCRTVGKHWIPGDCGSIGRIFLFCDPDSLANGIWRESAGRGEAGKKRAKFAQPDKLPSD